MDASVATVEDAVATFGLRGDPQRLPEGQGSSFRVGDAVIKPVVDGREAIWLATIVGSLHPAGLRLPEPIAARDGQWVSRGWAAWRWLEGIEAPGCRTDEKLAAARTLHAALADQPRPPFIGTRRHAWEFADLIVWGERSPDARLLTNRLWRRVATAVTPPRPGLPPAQVVHADLDGNVLFQEGSLPAIIDLSVYWRPPAWSEAVLLADTLIWGHAEEAIDALLLLGAGGEQLLARALMFRLTVSLLADRPNADDLDRMESAFDSLELS
jgi:uncharacterized protein (TIGR02569 family)